MQIQTRALYPHQISPTALHGSAGDAFIRNPCNITAGGKRRAEEIRGADMLREIEEVQRRVCMATRCRRAGAVNSKTGAVL